MLVISDLRARNAEQNHTCCPGRGGHKLQENIKPEARGATEEADPGLGHGVPGPLQLVLCLGVLAQLYVEERQAPGARVHCPVIPGRHGRGGDTQEGRVGGGGGEVNQLRGDGGRQLGDEVRG